MNDRESGSLSDVGPPHATDVRFRDDRLVVELDDGRTVSVPVRRFPRLEEASTEERQNWSLIGRGEGIHWPDLDEDISVYSLLMPENTVGDGTSLPSGRKDRGVAAYARGPAYQEALLDRAGGAWTTDEVAEHLRVNQDLVDERRRRGSLLAVWYGSGYCYPRCQFDETGVIDGLVEVLQAMDAERGWTKLSLLYSPVLTGAGAEGEAETVLEAVRQGHQESALHAARTWGTHGSD